MPSPSEKLPGIYRQSDQSPVSQAEALRLWVPFAFDELIVTAGKYNALVTYKELALRVQELSGIRTRVLITHWIGKLLEEVALLATTEGEPPLTSLCVRQDGTIGEGYAKAVGSDAGNDIELLSAEHRLACYQKYATDLPPGGGEVCLTPAERARRQPRRVPAATPDLVCPNCFVILPATKRCDDCGWTKALNPA